MSESRPDQSGAGAENLSAVTYTKATNWKPVWREWGCGGESDVGELGRESQGVSSACRWMGEEASVLRHFSSFLSEGVVVLA